MAKVLVLFSGSLASRIAGALAQRHPEVTSVQLLHFRSPFSRETEELRELVRTDWAGTTLRTQSLKREYRRFVEPGGGGFCLRTACMQCRALLVARSARYMERVGADYLVTGERLGRHELDCEDVEWLAERFGIQGRVLRPLCHRTPLAGTSLADWSGLGGSRTSRMTKDADLVRWAEELGLDASNALGSAMRCKLTLPGFGQRVARLFAEEGFTLNGLRLLDFAHYYNVEPGTKVVLAADEEEKRELQNLFLPEDLRVYPSTPHGPMALVRSNWDERTEEEQSRILDVAACIVATHACGGRASTVPIYYRLESDDETLLVNAKALGSVEELLRIPGVKGMALFALQPASA